MPIKNKNIDLTIIMPCYNEIRTINMAISEVLNSLDGRNEKIELLIIDNNSSDGTKEILKEFKHPLVQTIFNEKNIGKGGSVQKGYLHSKGNYVIIFDADLEYKADNIWNLYDKILTINSSLLLGARKDGYKNNREKGYLHFYLGVKMLTTLINILYGSKLTDSATCFKLIKGDLARNIKFSSNGFSLDFEIICKVLRLGYSVDEITVSYKQRSRKEGKKIKTIDGIISLLVIFRERFKLKKFILR